MTSVPPTQPPAAPENDVRLTEAERGALADAAATLGTDDYPGLLFDEVECIVAERVRVVEGEREHWKDHAEEAGRGFERVCLDYNRVAAARTAATARAESAEAAHEAEKAAHERLRAEIEKKIALYSQLAGRAMDPECREWLTAFVGTLRALLAGGGDR